MRRINTFALFTLGKHLRPIETMDEDNAIYGPTFIPLWDARDQVQALLRNEEISIRTCKQAATKLVDCINEIVPKDAKAAFANNKEAKLDWWSVRQLKEAAQKFETVLAEELNIVDTYAVAQKGAYSTSELVSNAEVMFSKAIQAKLPNKAIQDIREAGKCLAFETPTASAFHIVRAVESVILAYFEKVMGRKPPTRMRNWGVYISTLRDSGKADDKILDFLAHIKDTYRNPVSHPEAVLSVEEVLVLLGVAVSAMTQMALQL